MLKADTQIRNGDKYFDGVKWVSVYPWMIGQYVSKRTEKRFKRPRK